MLVNSAVRKGVKLERKACWQALVPLWTCMHRGLDCCTLPQAVACCAGRLSTLTIIVGCHRRLGFAPATPVVLRREVGVHAELAGGSALPEGNSLIPWSIKTIEVKSPVAGAWSAW